MTTITRDQVADEIRKVCTAAPETINPVGFDDEGKRICLYLDASGNCCLAGQVILNLTGIQIPADEFRGISAVCDSLPGVEVGNDANRLLDACQTVADNMTIYNKPNPQTWGATLDDLIDNGYFDA